MIPLPLIQIVIALVIIGLALYLVQLIPMAAPMPQIIKVVVIVCVVFWLLSELLPLLTVGSVPLIRR